MHVSKEHFMKVCTHTHTHIDSQFGGRGSLLWKGEDKAHPIQIAIRLDNISRASRLLSGLLCRFRAERASERETDRERQA